MSLKGKPSPSPAPLLKNAAAAPFIYFDGVPVYGAFDGNIEVELASRVLMPKSDGVTVTADLICTGHLRCSPSAAAMLIDALQKAIDMHNKAQEQATIELNS